MISGCGTGGGFASYTLTEIFFSVLHFFIHIQLLHTFSRRGALSGLQPWRRQAPRAAPSPSSCLSLCLAWLLRNPTTLASGIPRSSGKNGLTPSLVAEYAAQNDFGFLQPGDLEPDMQLTTLLNVHYDQPAGSFVYCGSAEFHEGSVFDLTPSADGPTNTPWNLRSARPNYTRDDFFDYVPNISWASGSGVLHTLVVMDPIDKEGESYLGVGPATLHALYTNVEHSVSVGSEADGFTLPYVGPGAPSTTIASQYEFILFEQTKRVDLDPNGTYAAELSGRMHFNLTKLQTELALGPIRGINWVFAFNDHFATYQVATMVNSSEMNCTHNATHAGSASEANLPALTSCLWMAIVLCCFSLRVS